MIKPSSTQPITRPRLMSLACLLSLAATPLRSNATAVPTPQEIVAQAPDADWQNVDPDRLLIMTLKNGRRVAIELAPQFAPSHVAAIVALTQKHWWDGGAITRVQDGYVTQWAGRESAPPVKAKHLPAEYEHPQGGVSVMWLNSPDAYASRTGFSDGWPIGGDGHQIWLAHCYGMVGVGRDMPPDTGDGTELYAVIGHAPRQLDRNIALVGRVLDGMDALASLPRGTGDLGFYTRPDARTPIISVVLAADMPASSRPGFQILRTDTASFAHYLQARENRRDAFYLRPAGGTDVCNVPLPARRTKQPQ